MHHAPLPRWLAVLLLMAIAITFGANHVAARVAFDHGTSVVTAVAARSVVATLFVLVLMAAQGVPVALAPAVRIRALAIGGLIAVQSYCIYSSVARIPVALALLAFNLYPLLFTLLSAWAGGERPGHRAMLALPLALVGLALVLDVFGKAVDAAGIAWALGAAVSFTLVLFLNDRWLRGVDGRVRTFYAMVAVAMLMLAGVGVAGGFALPSDAAGWTGLALLCVLYASALIAFFLVLPRVGAPSNTVALNVEPIAVMAMAWAVIGQAMNATQILGAFVVVGAITWLATARR
jgi:drug/metabolite transporter (DMT)-like permease